MLQRRRHSRVEVNFSIACAFPQPTDHTFHGQVTNVGLGGVKVILNVHLPALKSRWLNYSLILPRPFHPIVGRGRICWAHWDYTAEQMLLGMEFLSLRAHHEKELQAIVEELHDEPSRTRAPFQLSGRRENRG